MEVDSNTVLFDLDDKPLKDGETEATLGLVIKQGMLNLSQEEKNVTGDMKKKRYLLAKKFSKGGIVPVSQPEIDLIREVVGKNFIPVIVGRIDEILNNEFEIPHKSDRVIRELRDVSIAEDNIEAGVE